MVKYLCSTGYMLKQLNHSFIALIPKIGSPVNISQYHPISLCNVCYKVISKSLAAQLKEVLPKLISCNQNTFVPNRHIQDNLILVQEIMQTLKCKQGRGGLMAVKMDIEKAYDKVD